MLEKFQHFTQLSVLLSEQNIRTGLQCTEIIPFDPESVISRRDIKLKTPSSRPGTALPRVSKTPNNPINRNLLKPELRIIKIAL